MKLALVTETFPPEINGVAMTLGNLASGLAARGFEVVVHRPRQSADPQVSGLRPQVSGLRPQPSLGFREVLHPGVPIPGYAMLRAGLPVRGALLRAWRANRPDVFLAYLGDWGYRALMRLNRLYNKWRAWRGKEYYSISKAIKARVKQAVSHVSNFEQHIAELAKSRGCEGVMCGHIHTAADRMMGDVHYLNSGDWVESLTAIIEHHDGRMELIDFAEFRKDYPLEDETSEAAESLDPTEPKPA